MTQQESLQILIQAVRLANKRGAFELEESEMISQAIKIFIPPKPNQEDNQNSEDTSTGTEPTDNQ